MSDLDTFGLIGRKQITTGSIVLDQTYSIIIWFVISCFYNVYLYRTISIFCPACAQVSQRMQNAYLRLRWSTSFLSPDIFWNVLCHFDGRQCREWKYSRVCALRTLQFVYIPSYFIPILQYPRIQALKLFSRTHFQFPEELLIITFYLLIKASLHPCEFVFNSFRFFSLPKV